MRCCFSQNINGERNDLDYTQQLITVAIKNCSQPLTSEVISTLHLSCQFLAQHTHPYMSPEKGRKALLERLRQRM
jgi:hypothetical protein